MTFKTLLFSLTIISISTACSKSTDIADRPVVSVNDAVLTVSQLVSAIPLTASPEDSAVIAEEFIRRWLNQQVLLQKAKLNLTHEEADVDAAVEDYRRSLLVERYQQNLLKQKFHPEVSESDIYAYYDAMKENFRLNEHILKGIYAVIPNDAEGLADFKKLLRSLNDDSFMYVEDFLYKNSSKYEISIDKWITLSSVRKFFPPGSLMSEAQILKSKTLYETRDIDNTYLLLPTDCKLADAYAPVEYVSGDIKAILTNKSRMDFINSITQSLYDEAIRNNDIKFYDYQ